MQSFAYALILALSTAGLAHAGGADRYVSMLGNDTGNDCLLAASPCRTIQHAADLSGSSDYVMVAAGTHQEAVVLEAPINLEIRGGWDETFTSNDGTTVWRSKGIRPLTVLYENASGSLAIRDMTFAKSSQRPDADPDTQQGGAIYLRASGAAAAELLLSNTVLTGNKAESGGAVAVIAEGGASTELSILGSTFSKNKAFACGAVLVDAIDSPPAEVLFLDVTFEKNKATTQGGAACLSVTDATGTQRNQQIIRSRFLGNKAESGGALVAVVIEGGRLDPEVEASVFLRNRSVTGGGIASFAIAGPADLLAETNLTTTNNTFSGNRAKLFGAGTLAVALVNPFDGSTTASATHTSTNDIVYGNKGGDAVIFADPGASATLERQYGIFGELGNAGGSIVDGPGLIALDPLLVDPGKDPHLQATSPAIDAGSCADAPTHDFESDPFPDDVGCDIGADEF